MEDSQEKDYSFLGNDTFPNLHDALVYEWKFKSEYLERQIYERPLKSEPSIVKLIDNQSEHLIENQSEHLSKLTLYHLKKRATRRSRRARGEICLQKDFNEIPKPSKLYHYVNQSRAQSSPAPQSAVGRRGEF